MPPTLTELKHRWDEVFAESQQAIDKSRQMARDNRAIQTELRRTMDELDQVERSE